MFNFGSKSEAAIFTDPTSLRYLTGVNFTAGAAVIGPSRRALFVDGRYFFKARRLLRGKWEVIQTSPGGFGEMIGKIKSFGIRKICVDTESLSAARFKKLAAAVDGIEISEAEGLADRIRTVKRPEELKLIREAVRITDELWTRIRQEFRLGMTERELLAHIKEEAIRMAA